MIPLPVILPVQKEYVMLLNIEDWYLLSYYFIIMTINTLGCSGNIFTACYYSFSYFPIVANESEVLHNQ